MASPAAAAQQRPWLSGERTKCTLSVEQCILSLKDFMPDPTVTDAWQNMNTDAIIEEYSKVLLSFAAQTKWYKLCSASAGFLVPAPLLQTLHHHLAKSKKRGRSRKLLQVFGAHAKLSLQLCFLQLVSAAIPMILCFLQGTSGE